VKHPEPPYALCIELTHDSHEPTLMSRGSQKPDNELPNSYPLGEHCKCNADAPNYADLEADYT